MLVDRSRAAIPADFTLAITCAMCVALSWSAAAAGSKPGGHSGGGEGGAAAPHFVAMAPLDVPIVEGDRADGRLKITLVLEAADAAGASALETRLPECREAALAASIEFARLRASPSSPVDAQRLANDLSIALRPVDRAIAAVLLVEVSARRA